MSTVSDLIAAAQARTTTLTGAASAALSTATSAVTNMGFTITSYSPLTLPVAPTTPGALTPPTLSPVTLTLPAAPGGAPAFQAIAAPALGSVPTLSGSAPSMNMPNKPSQLHQFNYTSPGVNTSFAFPTPPSELTNPLIAAPTLNDRAEPTAPQVSLPELERRQHRYHHERADQESADDLDGSRDDAGCQRDKTDIEERGIV